MRRIAGIALGVFVVGVFTLPLVLAQIGDRQLEIAIGKAKAAVSLMASAQESQSPSGQQEMLQRAWSIPWGSELGHIGLQTRQVGPQRFLWDIEMPFAVDVATGRLIVADRWNRRIQVFDSTGNLISVIEGQETKHGKFRQILDLTVNPKGDMVVLDYERVSNRDDHRLLFFDNKGNLKKEIVGLPLGQPGYEIFLDGKGNIYFKQTYDIFTYMYDNHGQYVRRIGDPERFHLYAGLIPTPVGEFISISEGMLNILDRSGQLKQRIAIADLTTRLYGPIQLDITGNLYLYGKNSPERVFEIFKVLPSGQIGFKREFSIQKQVYQGIELESLVEPKWFEMTPDGTVYFLKPTAEGAEIWRLRTAG